MKYQIKKISVLQTSKVQAICYAPIGLIHLVIGLLILSSSEADTAAKAVGTLFLFMPLIIGVMTFFSTFIIGHFYNWIASMIGGVEFEIEEIPSSH